MSTAGDDPQAGSLGYWVFRLNRAMYAALADRLAPLGVSPPEWAVLARAGRAGVTPAALADGLGVDRAAVTRLVDQLERKRLVRRTPHPTDRRSTVVALTAAGRRLLPKLVAASRETNREFLTLLPAADAGVLLATLRVIGERLPVRVYPLDPAGD